MLPPDTYPKHRRDRKSLCKTVLTTLAISIAFSIIAFLLLRQESTPFDFAHRCETKSRIFADFNNDTGSNTQFIVPNIIHFIIFETDIHFTLFICILAALKNQRPEKIFFHTNHQTFKGEYWPRLTSLKPFTDVLEIRKIQTPIEFDQTIVAGFDIWHITNIIRMETLMQYGGIYVDNDVYIIKSLDFFRNFELAIGYVENIFVGNQLIVAHKDARFLELWLHTYNKVYDISKWYYNEGELPTTPELRKHPEMLHRVKLQFGNVTDVATSLFEEFWQYLLHNVWEEAYYPVDFDEQNLQKYPIHFQEIAQEALRYEKSQRRDEN